MFVDNPVLFSCLQLKTACELFLGSQEQRVRVYSAFDLYLLMGSAIKQEILPPKKSPNWGDMECVKGQDFGCCCCRRLSSLLFLDQNPHSDLHTQHTPPYPVLVGLGVRLVENGGLYHGQ